jgi:hypothetical protein
MIRPRLALVLTFLAACLTFSTRANAQISSFTQDGQPMGSGGSGGGTGGGDLWIYLACEAESHTDFMDGTAYLSLWIYVEGQQVAYGEFEGEGTAYGYVETWVRASTQDRYAECDSSGPYADGSDSGTIPGSGPGSATIKIDAFIPEEWVGNPWNPYRIFEGDYRPFGYYQGSARGVTVYDVLNPAVNDGDVLDGPYHEAGLSVEYDIPTSLDNIPPYGHITDAARNDWTWDVPMKTRWAMADTSGMSCSPPARQGPSGDFSTHQIHCTTSVSIPLAAAPAIQWDLTITLGYGENQIRYTVVGCHSYFPAFETYVNGYPLFQHSDSGNPNDLFSGCAYNVSSSGVIYE